MIKIENLNIYKKKAIIKNSNLVLENGKMTAIIGPTGSGKTSILYVVGLLDKIKHCNYEFEGHLINSYNDFKLSKLRQKYISFVFQDNNMFEDMSILDNFRIMYQLIDEPCDNEKINQLMTLFQLDMPVHRLCHQLSRGQKQRLAIALSLIKRPKLLILDEPTSYLDEENEEIIINVLKHLKTENMMILISTHSKKLIDQCDKVLQIEDQKVVDHDTLISNKEKLKFKKVSRRLFKTYIQLQLKYHPLLYVLLIIISSLCLNIQVFTQNFSTFYYNTLTKDVNQLENLYLDVVFDNQIKVEDYIKILKQEKGIANIYSYQIEDHEIVPLLNAQLIEPYLIFSTHTKGAYVHEDLSYLKEVEIQGKKIEVVGVFNGEYKDLIISYTPKIYVDYELMNFDDFSNELIVQVNSIKDLKSVKERIELFDEIQYVNPTLKDYLFIQQQINDLEKLLTVISGVLVGICSLIIVGTMIKHYYLKIEDICILKANGLSKKEILLLMGLDMLLIIVSFIIMSSCVVLLQNQIFKHFLNSTVMTIHSIIQYFMYMIFLYVLGSFLVLVKISQKQVASIIRS